ncbi:MAG: antibiotic biosynthesis monooxygenase [Phycisphaerae bacterium]|nr:antibiotic biosynthesis monooxygenase [Phycisphaerae bacterium]
MYIVHVFARVKPDQVEPFRRATLVNAQASCRTEAGVARFDVLQQQDDPTRFLLVEVYRTQEDAGWHKGTAHYLAWRDAVAPMMAEPRSSLKYTNVFPDDQGWRPVPYAVQDMDPRRHPTGTPVGSGLKGRILASVL